MVLLPCMSAQLSFSFRLLLCGLFFTSAASVDSSSPSNYLVSPEKHCKLLITLNKVSLKGEPIDQK